MKKFLRGVVALVVLYYVGVNGLLASPFGPRLLNARPELVQIHYSRAWTVVPFQFEVRDFRLSMQDRLVQIEITADRVQGNLHPWTLREQRFFATGVDATGVTMRVRPRMNAGEEAHLDELAPIAGYETPVRDQSANEVQAKDIRFLSLEFADLTIHDLREVWIGRVRYAGHAELSGGMLYEPFRRLRLDDVHVVGANGRLMAHDPRHVVVERLDARVSLDETNMSAPAVTALRGLTADVQLSALADSRFLNSHLTHVKGLSTLQASGAPGKLELDVKVTKGVVADGGALSYATPRLAVRLPYVQVSGAAAVTGKAAHGRLALELKITDASLTQRDAKELARANMFTLEAVSPADLTRLPDVDAVLTLKGGALNSLDSLNQFIPDGTGVRLAGGKGLVEGTLSIDAASAKAHGSLELTADDVTLKNRSATARARLLVHGAIRSLDLNTGALDLSGSTVALEDVAIAALGQSWSKLWLRAVADPCFLTPRGDTLWSTTLAVGSSNLQPLLALVSANAPIPKALMPFSDAPNVRVEVDLAVRKDGVQLPHLLLTAAGLRLEGSLSLRDLPGADEKLEPWGKVMGNAGVFKFGVQLQGPAIELF